MVARSRARTTDPPRRLARRHAIVRETVRGRPVEHLTPTGVARDAPGVRLLYFPGGAYVNEMLGQHWRFIARLTARVRAPATVARYPLAPEASVDDGLAFADTVYRSHLADDVRATLIAVGDSAGASLLLSYLFTAARAGLRLPDGIVLVSPWLDLTLADTKTHPATADIVNHPAALHVAARWWADGADLTDERVSPLFGDLSGFPPILVLGGSADMLASDARTLARRWPTVVELSEAPGLMHGYPLLPVPEARSAMTQIAAFVDHCAAARRP